MFAQWINKEIWSLSIYYFFSAHLFLVADDWPGFDVLPVPNDSLWDNDYNPLDPLTNWSPTVVEPPAPPVVSLFFFLVS